MAMLQNLFKKIRKTNAESQGQPALMNAYSRLPIAFDRGEGAELWDTDGKQYIDALGGIAVTFLGHAHPSITEAISLQADKLLHVSNLFHIQEQGRLGEKFCRISDMDKVFFGNSGAEANEAAIKIARLHANAKGIQNPTIVTMKNSFHGRTMATLSATGNRAIQKGFAPLVSEFIHVEYNDVNAIKAHHDNANIVAVMVEPIQGEGGVIVPDDGYLKAVRALCDKQGWLLIIDEIQTGMGRTGEWFAYMHEGILPDIITSAKALGNGIPIGACAARGDAAKLIAPGMHGTTFGGNPFVSQVAATVIDVIEAESLLERASTLGLELRTHFQNDLGDSEKVVDIRGLGLMIGIELDQAYPDLAMRFLEHGLVVNITGGGKVIRLLPPAVLSDQQVERITQIIRDVVLAL